LRYRQINAAGQWSEVITPDDEALRHGSIIALAIAPDDTVYALFSSFTSNAVYLTHMHNRSGWETLQALNSALGDLYSGNLDMLFEPTGRLHLVHTAYAAEHGAINHLTPVTARESGDSILSRQVTIPMTMTAPTLSFVYLIRSVVEVGGVTLTAEIHDGNTTTTVFITQEATGEWDHAWANMSRWKGKTVTITFRAPHIAGQPMPQAFVDEVSLGTAYPDVWVEASATAAWPGEPVTYWLNYGNQGGARSAARVLTFTLPAEVNFVSASVPPLSTSPLKWAIDELPAKSNPYSIEIVGMVSSSAVPDELLVGTAAIQTTGELETLNNTVEVGALVSRISYLPMAVRP
jgi:uncharacterized repeat protein (TIGR01451 family)